MPLNPLDFSRFVKEKPSLGLGDIFSNYYKGMEYAQTPQKLAQERLARELQNTLFGEQITGKQLENQYYPQVKEAEILSQNLQNQERQEKLPYVGKSAEADYEAKLLQNAIDAMKRQNEPERFKNEQRKNVADALYKEEEAKKSRAEAELKEMEAKLYNSDYQAEGGFPLQLMSPGERNEVVKDMRKEQRIAQSDMKVNKIAKDMLALIDKHPNIADKFAQVWAHADEDDPKVWDKIRRKIANKEDLAAFEKFRKDAARLVIAKADSMGGRITDAKLKLIENMKASPYHTDEANRYMLQGEIYDTDPAEAYNQALEKGFNTRRRPALDKEAYRQKVDLDSLPDPFK